MMAPHLGKVRGHHPAPQTTLGDHHVLPLRSSPRGRRRLLTRPARRPRPAPSVGFRPRLEGLDERIVPTVDHWQPGGDPNPSGMKAADWSNGLPQQGDTVLFDSSDVHDCPGLQNNPAAYSQFAALAIQAGYTGTVTLTNSSSPVMNVTVGGGTLAAASLTVLSNLVWTGGTITGGTLNIAPGATAGINPAGNGVTAGSSINFLSNTQVTPAVVSTGTIQNGTVTFVNGAGLTVAAACKVQIGPDNPPAQGAAGSPRPSRRGC